MAIQLMGFAPLNPSYDHAYEPNTSLKNLAIDAFD